MNILFTITDSSGYKTYLELKNYLHNNNCDVNLNYYYIEANLRDIIYDSNYYFNHDYNILKSNNLIDSLVVNSFIYRDLIDNRIKYLDNLVDEYVKR